MPKTLVLQCAALGYDFLRENRPGLKVGPLEFKSTQSLFPALTCPIQAAVRTAGDASEHGITANGFFSRELSKPMFWEQSSALVEGPRIWDRLRDSGGTVGQLFFQQSLGRDSDFILSPAPIHKHGGGMIDDCYCRPKGLYANLTKKIGRKFKLRWYWGPMASIKSSRWITEAVKAVLNQPAPDLLMAYLPHLDYQLQKTGPDSPEAREALNELFPMLEDICECAEAADYNVVVFGDYAIGEVDHPILPNKALKEAGLFSTRPVKGMLYPDFASSKAFAMVDHQIAHVIIPEEKHLEEAAEVLRGTDGVKRVIGREEKSELGIDHPRCGELVIEAEPDAWFAYYWWDYKKEAPDYAGHVDIHNKPGFDPCELFFGRTPLSVSTDPSKIKGSHGSTGQGREVAWASTLSLEKEPDSLLELSRLLRGHLTRIFHAFSVP